MVDPVKTPEEIEKELSVENFAKQQARTLGLNLGGTLLGVGAGYLAFKSGITKSLNKYKFVRALGGEKSVLMVGGGLIGSVVGGIASLYEHWVKVEREQLNVQEINKDVSHLMQKRVEFENTIDKQQAVIDAMLQKYAPANSKGEKALSDKANATELRK